MDSVDKKIMSGNAAASFPSTLLSGSPTPYPVHGREGRFSSPLHLKGTEFATRGLRHHPQLTTADFIPYENPQAGLPRTVHQC